MNNFGENAKSLSKNPIGIIALFIVLIYGFASLVVGSSGELTPQERGPIIWFMVVFPIVVIGVFSWLVVKHHEKLYSPSDFKDEKYFYDLKHSLKGEIEKDVTQKVLVKLSEKVELLKEDFELESFNLRMRTYMVDGRWEEASEYADKILEKNRNSSSLIHKAYILKRQGNIEKALEFVDKSIEANSFPHDKDKALVFYNRACYRALLGKSKEQIFDDLDRAISMDNEYKELITTDSDLSGIYKEYLCRNEQ